MTTHLPERALLILLRVLEALDQAGLDHMLVGSLATFVWGDPRTTRDIDVAVHIGGASWEEVEAALLKTGANVEGPFTTRFGPRFILPFPQGMPVDVFLSEEGDAFRRSKEVELDGHPIAVQCPEDLVLTKLRNDADLGEDRGLDLGDAAAVLFKQWPRFDFEAARDRCAAFDVCDALEALVEEVRRERGARDLPV